VDRPRYDEAVRGLDGYEQMVDTFAQNAKTYWRLWGTLGEPMVHGIEAWAEVQHGYIQWLRKTYNGEKRL